MSAYAKAGARCRHNLNYWQFGDYVGIGAGAHGKLTLDAPARILRTTKPKQPREYQEQVRDAWGSVGESAYIAVPDLSFEFMLNALRLNEGFTLDCFRTRTGIDPAVIAPKLAAAQARGLLEQLSDGWQPTELGRRFLNDLQASFLG